MPEEREEMVYRALAELGIPFSKRDHPPAATVEEAVRYWEGLPGARCKNLFVRNKKGNHHYLIIAEHRRAVDLKSLARLLRDDRLSFASGERMERFLGLHPGEVSPFGLLQDGGREVVVVLDESLREAAFVSFHPNVNTATVTIAFADLKKFLDWRGNKVIFIRF